MQKLIDGGKITRLRELKGWSQQDLAEYSGVDGSVISRLERNIQSDFKVSVIYAVANALDTTIDDLLLPDVQIEVGEFIPVLEVALRSLSRQTPFAQNQIAKIIQAYISSLEDE